MNHPSKSLIAYTFSHFCVDFTCFYILFHGFRNSTDMIETIAIGFLVYNVIAFGLQPLIGYFCDDRPRLPVGIIGCGIVTAGLLVLFLPSPISLSFSWLALCLGAFGNACFHIGGGIDALRYAKGKMSRSGIFVSTGALGVAFGTMTGKSETPAGFLPLLLMAASILTLVIFTRSASFAPDPFNAKAGSMKTPQSGSALFNIASDLPFVPLLLFALGSIAIRSFAGGVIPMTWKTGVFLALLPGIGACAGKALGGILGDRFGAKTVGVSALLLSIPLLVFGKETALLSVAGILLFNMTMPVTLCAVASKFPRNPGLAFGLTTLALLGGNMPSFFFSVPQQAVSAVLIPLVVLSAALTWFSTQNKKGEQPYETDPS
jgi:FSR family fosmidomycin resistance protein-like MFS transporter